ncbi:MAG: CRISPR-associated protein Cas5 [Thermomicrobium sp.]|nr:CRISPR-associated protein Cas5 [Thermomicrobium sp.]MDW8060863.1 CRISPR-associated protein Cas5 [Thermomicrobium sp.]
MSEVVLCDLRGKFGHFRRFYTNSSSLSYPIPPPTVVRGIVGGALGLERDEYADRLAELRMGIGVRQPLRTIMQTINALMVKSASDKELRGFAARTQIPTQLVLPDTERDEWNSAALRYRLVLVPPTWLSAAELAAALRAPVFPPALGVAYCLAWFEEIDVREGTLGKDDPEFAEYHGALDAERVEEFALESGVRRKLSRDRYPLRLDRNRRLLAATDLIVDLLGHPIRCRYRGPWVQIGEERWALIG